MFYFLTDAFRDFKNSFSDSKMCTLLLRGGITCDIYWVHLISRLTLKSFVIFYLDDLVIDENEILLKSPIIVALSPFGPLWLVVLIYNIRYSTVECTYFCYTNILHWYKLAVLFVWFVLPSFWQRYLNKYNKINR